MNSVQSRAVPRPVRRRLPPPALLAIALGGTILIGTVLLRLPIAHANGSVGWLDAFFTATSAACVTGLVVVDTGTRFSTFGQVVILALIQIGGLGVMTIGTMVMLALGYRPTPFVRQMIRGFAGHRESLRVRDLLVAVLALTFCVEAIGATILFVVFAQTYAIERALWAAVFHSVSAFCNAGFSLWGDSLSAFAHDPLVNLTIMALIVSGGLGFVVLLEIYRWTGSRLRRTGPLERFSVHSKIILTGTVFAIVTGAVLFLLLENGNVLAGRVSSDQLLVATFQSVTARTAGFNTVAIEALSNPTILVLMTLMFVGAGPGSMAGGIKLTSAVAVFALVTQRLRGGSEVRLFGRSIGEITLQRAVIMAVLGLASIAVAVCLLEVVRHSGPPSESARAELLPVVFEVVSAFATVGLSMGITADLGPASRLLLIPLMFIGRLGPVTLMDYFAHRPPPPPIRHATEELMIA